MDHIENAGKKGYCFMYFFIAIIAIIILFVAIYKYNFRLTF